MDEIYDVLHQFIDESLCKKISEEKKISRILFESLMFLSKCYGSLWTAALMRRNIVNVNIENKDNSKLNNTIELM